MQSCSLLLDVLFFSQLKKVVMWVMATRTMHRCIWSIVWPCKQHVCVRAGYALLYSANKCSRTTEINSNTLKYVWKVSKVLLTIRFILNAHTHIHTETHTHASTKCIQIILPLNRCFKTTINAHMLVAAIRV